MMANQNNDVMQRLVRGLTVLSGNPSTNHARIRAALLAAMAEGADEATIFRMARAVGLQEVDSNT